MRTRRSRRMDEYHVFAGVGMAIVLSLAWWLGQLGDD